MNKKPLTESDSHYDHLEQMSVAELLTSINAEDKKVAVAVEKCLPEIERLVLRIVSRMDQGGRLFYIGAGTSGRLGIVDASECPPTFGVEHGLVVGIIAGGDGAIRKAVEFSEDDQEQGWKDLNAHKITSKDTIIGIAASGNTPYVIAAIESSRKANCLTACITCNADTKLAKASEHAIEVLVGPEFVTGSTRMKSGTAQKMVLNMISTSVMVQLGHVHGNKMVDMQLSNAKLVDRGIKMLMEQLSVNESEAKNLLSQYGSVREAITEHRKKA